MFEYFRGKLVSSGTDFAVVETVGVAYRLQISLNSSLQLPDENSEVLIYAYLHITENSQALFGFMSREERQLFKLLIAVNKIGPKVALSVLSTLTTGQLYTAVENADVTALKSVSGIGPKTASLILLELKGKLTALYGDSFSAKSERIAPANNSSVEDDAYGALLALGYSDASIKQALSKIRLDIGDEVIPVEEWITRALRII